MLVHVYLPYTSLVIHRVFDILNLLNLFAESTACVLVIGNYNSTYFHQCNKRGIRQMGQTSNIHKIRHANCSSFG